MIRLIPMSPPDQGLIQMIEKLERVICEAYSLPAELLRDSGKRTAAEYSRVVEIKRKVK